MQLFTDTIECFTDLEPIQFMRHSFKKDEITHSDKSNHMHPFCELYVLIDGEVDFNLGDRTRRLSTTGADARGWIVITRAGEFHSALVRMHNYDHFYMFFNDRCLPTHKEDEYPLRDFMNREAYEDNIFQPSAEAWRKMSSLIDKMTELARSEHPLRQYEEFSAALGLITLVSREWTRVFGEKKVEENPANAENNCISSPIVRRAVTYIENNFRTLRSLAVVAESCGVSQSYLSRVFHEQIGQRPNEYLRRKRLEYAKTLLLNGFDVTSVCYHVGFGDYSHFIQVFRKYEGTTPLAFQQTHGVMRNDYHTTPD